MKRPNRRLFVVFCIIIVDQTVKLLLSTWGYGYLINRGIGLGLFGENFNLGILLNFLGIVIAGYFLVKKKIYWLNFSLIFGAGVSNFLDRVFRGGVIDYINFLFFSFNLADLIITLSLIHLLILYIIKND